MLIARALLLDIRLLVADEIIWMLDASTRIDVLNLLGDLKARGLGILFITHDLSLGNYISDRADDHAPRRRGRDGRDRAASSATRCTRTRRCCSPRCRSCTRSGPTRRRPRGRTRTVAGTLVEVEDDHFVAVGGRMSAACEPRSPAGGAPAASRGRSGRRDRATSSGARAATRSSRATCPALEQHLQLGRRPVRATASPASSASTTRAAR